MNFKDLKVGDRVVIKGFTSNGHQEEKYGVIAYMGISDLCVDHDTKYSDDLHNCSGRVPSNKGWWYTENEVERHFKITFKTKKEATQMDRGQINEMFNKLVKGDEIDRLKSDLKASDDEVDNYTKRLISATKKRNELSKKVAHWQAEMFDFYEKVQEISRGGKVEKVEVNIDKKCVSAFTIPLVFIATNGGRYQLGRFRIEYYPKTNDVRFFGLDDNYKNKSYWTSKDPHPHVDGSNGKACLGNTSESIAYLCSEFEYQALFEILIAFLEQANLDDCAGKHAMNWDLIDKEGNVIREGHKDKPYNEFIYGKTPEEDKIKGRRQYCFHCDDRFEEDDMTYINGEWVCDDCRDDNYCECADCGDWIHDDDVTIIDGEQYCENCTLYCEECETYVRNQDYNDEAGMCNECCKRIEENKDSVPPVTPTPFDAPQLDAPQLDAPRTDGTHFYCNECKQWLDKTANDAYIDAMGREVCEACYNKMF